MSFEDRFLDKVKRAANGCWVWTGALASNGYGKLTVNKRSCRAHRVSYELFCGPIPDGLFTLHHCDNPPCVNPTHLFLGDVIANWQDMVSKGRGKAGGLFVNPENRKAGEESHFAKLTAQQVAAIRLEYVPRIVTCKMLGNKYGVCEDTIRNVLAGRTWVA